MKNATNWDFSAVHPSEVRNCCVYEYLREGEHVRVDRTRFLDQQHESQPLDRDSTAELILVRSRIPSFWFRSDPPAPAWLDLTDQQKQVVAHAITMFVKSMPVIPPVALPKLGDFGFMLEQQQLIDASCSSWIPEKDEVIEPALFVDQQTALATFRINLAGCTDDQIIEELRGKLSAMRERWGIEEPQRKGDRDSAWRSNLENLTMMRLRHTFPPQDVIKQLVKLRISCWGQNQFMPERIAAIEKHRTRAIQFFRELSYDLPPDARPASAAIWAKPGSKRGGIAPVAER